MFFLLGIFVITSAGEAKPTKKWVVVYDFSDDWLAFDDQAQQYMPLLAMVSRRPSTLSVYMPIADYAGYQLLIESSENHYLFINAQLVRNVEKNKSMYLSIDSLRNKYKKNTLLFSFYNPTSPSVILPKVVVARLVTDSGGLEANNEDNNLINPTKRKPWLFQTFIIGFGVCLLGFLVFLAFLSPIVLLILQYQQSTLSPLKRCRFQVNRPSSSALYRQSQPCDEFWLAIAPILQSFGRFWVQYIL